MAATPEVRVNVTASVAKLEQNMAKAEQIVKTSSAKIETTAKRVIGQSLDEAFQRAGKSAKVFGDSVQFAEAAARAISGDLEGAIVALPGPFGAAGAAGLAAGAAIHEAFTGAKAALEQAAAEVAKLEKASGYKAQARDAERLLQIQQEMDPVRKIELERMNELAIARRKSRMAESEGAGHEAAAAAAAEERLINARAEMKLREHNKQLAEQQAKAEEEAAKQAQELAEQVRQQQEARQQAEQRGQLAIEQANTLQAMTLATTNAEKMQIQLEQDLRDIERERLENAKEMGDVLAEQVAEAQKSARVAQDQVALESELKAKRQELQELQQASTGGGSVQSVDFGFGGSLLVATNSAQKQIAQSSQKQLELQTQIAALVKAIARNTSNVSGGGLQ